ncbi:hypothetical protein ACFV27_38640 [Streptomyces antimycoticus]|uniref:hypothetical protein n=1 Tax=Streptomyces antimycoticus TaxID=68175 RepID=UPI0036BE7645
MRYFDVGETVVRRDVYRGQAWSEQALRVVADTDMALVTACCPGAEACWRAHYVKAHTESDRAVGTEAFEAMAAGEWELAPGVWQDIQLLLWKPPTAWFSINAFFAPDPGYPHRLRNWYVNFEHLITRTIGGFDTFDRALNLLIEPDLTR